MADGRVYMLQPSFATGEVSPDVASRVDLDKYQSALLQAKNFFVRPYGSVYRRPGLEHMYTLDGAKTRLQEFAVDADTSYLLAFRESFINIFKDEGGELVLKATIANSPFAGWELEKLRFAQSADVMFITSGRHPVQVLTRHSDTSWTIEDMVLDASYYDVLTETEGVTVSASATTGTVTLTASGDIFDAGQVGNWLRIEHEMDSLTVSLSNKTVTGGAMTFSKDINYKYRLTVTGTWEGTVRVQNRLGSSWQTAHSTTANETYTSDAQGTGYVDREYRYEAEIDSGTAELTLEILDADNADAVINTVSASISGQFGASGLLVGPKGWKLLTHGDWRGTVTLESSKDNNNWKALRKYTSDKDSNVSESGTFDEATYIRINADISSGKLYADLTRVPYTHQGTVKLTGYTDAKHMDGTVVDDIANTSPSDSYALGPWSGSYGYPSCVTFFQDRLCFAANNQYPYMVWMSRTADYYNFGTEEIEGTLTDDSAVTISFISRRDFRILHLVAQTDLIVMTEGNEWIVSGSSTVKPTDVNPQVQTSRGTTDVIPVMVGGQMIYVQRHGRTVRDLQYNYTTDSYDGMDLTILAKHITQNAMITDAAYRQEPDYMMWFILSDGTAACLTYINEQKVYAWSRMVTDGQIEAVETITTPDGDEVYFVVQRSNGMFLERLADVPESEYPMDYIMLDCAGVGEYSEPQNTITVPWLAGRTVDVLADGRHIAKLQADGTGTVTLDVPCYTYVMGLPYESVMELPNIEIQMPDGTMQGWKKKIASVILRLRNSLAGRVGITEAKTDVIKYDELMAQEVTLYSGEKNVTVPNVTVGGFNDWGRVVITSNAPYPLSVASVVRAVVPGG